MSGFRIIQLLLSVLDSFIGGILNTSSRCISVAYLLSCLFFLKVSSSIKPELYLCIIASASPGDNGPWYSALSTMAIAKMGPDDSLRNNTSPGRTNWKGGQRTLLNLDSIVFSLVIILSIDGCVRIARWPLMENLIQTWAKITALIPASNFFSSDAISMSLSILLLIF